MSSTRRAGGAGCSAPTVTLASCHSAAARRVTPASRCDASTRAGQRCAPTSRPPRPRHAMLVVGPPMASAPFHDVHVGNALELRPASGPRCDRLGRVHSGASCFRHTLVLLPGRMRRGSRTGATSSTSAHGHGRPSPPSPLDDATAVAGGEVDDKLLAFGNRDGHVIERGLRPGAPALARRRGPSPQAPDDGRVRRAVRLRPCSASVTKSVVLGLHTDTTATRHSGSSTTS